VSEGAWPIVSLGELIASIEAGASFRCRETPPEADEVGVAKVSAVSWGRYDENESKTCLNASRIDPSLLIQKGDFLISRANTVQLVGACVIAERVTKQVMLSDKTLRIQFRDPSLKPWVLHYLRSREGRNQIEALCTGNQETMRNISQKSIRQIQLPLAPAEERDRVIAYLDQQLSCLQASIEIFGTIQAKIKQARASILKAAVEGRLVETEANKSNGRLSDHSSSQDQHEGIATPEGWSIHQAKTVCNSIESGSTPSKEHFRDSPDEAVPFIKVYHLTFIGKLSFWENKPTYVSKEYHSSKMKRSLTIPGDVLTNIVGPPLGKVSVVPSKSHEWNINQAIARFRCGPTLMPAFLAIYLQSYQAQSWLASTSKTTTSQVNLSISNSRLLPIPVPPFHEQEQIVAEVVRRFSVLDQVEATVTASLARCGVLRQAILKRAFRQDAT
jgi:type I restriction enzyme S subunit